MTTETFSPGTKGIITNLVKLIRREQADMLLPGIQGEQRTFEVHCYATPINYITSESAFSRTIFFRAFATLNLWHSHF